PYLASAIRYHYKLEFHATLQKGAAIDFSGLDNKGKNVNPPLIDAILYYNDWAFEELLKKGADINKATKGDFVPLFHAVSHGNLRIVRALIAKGADPSDYRQGTTCLSLALECLRSGTLLEPQSRWRYENESPDTNNTALKQQISDFFLQENAYTPPKPNQAIPFVAPEQIHVYSAGNLDIIGFLLLKGVPPTMAVSETDRSPLAIVQNPTKYSDIFRSDPKEQLEYIGTETENPNILLFTMTLVNKRFTGTIPSIVVHYDIEPAKKLIEAAALAHSNPQLQSQLDAVHAKLHGATAQFAEEIKGVKEAFNYDEKQEIERFKLFIKGHPNAEEAYNTILSRLKSIHKSAQAVAGGGVVVSEGSLGLVAKVLDVSTELVDAIPLVGAAASKFFGLAASATREVDSRRQTNIYENIAAMVPATGAGRIFESVARKLTMAYLSQFQRLQTKEEARSHMSRPTELVQNTLKGRFISPAERVAAFAIIWMMDDVFNNMHQLERELQAPNGLERLLLNVVTQRKPEQG
ncbi:MAG TPA: ankyrin repeat domain-containing protein, partial [Gammaproteobacteria bacterium]|nr:ankyrin repeat domain-containing protein [Gammaproteobacteria bacterium]